MTPRALLLLAVLLAAVHFVMRGLGLGEHTSIIAGMPQSDASWLLGPLYALSWLAFVAVVPVLILTAALAMALDAIEGS